MCINLFYKLNSLLYFNPASDWYDAKTEEIIDWFKSTAITITDSILSVIAIGVLGYIIFQAIIFMFLNEEKSFQKAMLGYFGFMLIRILNIILIFKLS